MVEIGPSPRLQERQSQAIYIRKSWWQRHWKRSHPTLQHTHSVTLIYQKKVSLWKFHVRLVRPGGGKAEGWQRPPVQLTVAFYAKGDNSVTICPNTLGLAAMMSPLYR